MYIPFPVVGTNEEDTCYMCVPQQRKGELSVVVLDSPLKAVFASPQTRFQLLSEHRSEQVCSTDGALYLSHQTSHMSMSEICSVSCSVFSEG